MTNPARQSGEKMRLGVYAEGTDCFTQFSGSIRIFPISFHTLEASLDRWAAV